MPPHRIRAELQSWRGFYEDYQIAGFRAPWYQSTEELDSVLPEFFCYDSSVPTTSYQSAHGGIRGCCTVVPFRKQSLPIIPMTMPSEEELLVRNYQADDIQSAWRETAAVVRRVQGGVGVFAGHWDPGHLAREDLFEAHEHFLCSLGDQWVTDLLPGAFVRDRFVKIAV